ncbi:MAG: cupredoxin domain-containing protein [Solirubrobacteraceae bacterium]
MIEKRAVAAGIAAVALLAAAPGAFAKTYNLTAGPVSRPPNKQLDADAFFSKKITIHRGDTVSWAIHGFHTVAFPGKGKQPPPLIIANAASPVLGALDPAGVPFWFNGKAPSLQVNPLAQLPAGGHTYTGSGYANSGLPPGGPGKPFAYKLKFSKTGSFRYFCIVHPGMEGTIKVVAPGRKAQTPGQVHAAALAQQARVFKQAALLGKIKPAGGHVRVGNDSNGATWLRFFPHNRTVKVGQTVTFDMHARDEIHTVTFGPESYTLGLENSFTQVTPQPGGPPSVSLDPVSAYSSDPRPLPPYDGTNHKIGFENSGILSNTGPQPSSASFTFTKPGTYRYECVIHQGMDGTITVTA